MTEPIIPKQKPLSGITADRDKPNESLIQIGGNKYVDTDGVVHISDGRIDTETGALFDIFGGALIVR